MWGAPIRQQTTCRLIAIAIATLVGGLGRPAAGPAPSAGAVHLTEATEALAADRLDDAARALAAAYAAGLDGDGLWTLCASAQDLAGRQRDLLAYGAARAALALSRRAAITGGWGEFLWRADLLTSDLDRLSGDFTSAQATLERLAPAVPAARRPWIELKLGILYLDTDHAGRALAPLTRVLHLPLVGGEQSGEVIASAHQNLAVAYNHLGQRAQARLHYFLAFWYGDPADPPFELAFTRARILYATGDYAAAARALVIATGGALDGEWSWGIPLMLGNAERQLGHRTAALVGYLAAIDAVRTLRAGVGAHEPSVIASHREPYQQLFGLLAEAGQWRAVLGGLADLDARHMIDAMVPAPRITESGELAVAVGAGAAPVTPLVADRAPPAVDAIVEAWRGRWLVAVFPAGDRLCRLEVKDGVLTGTCVGDRGALERDAETLEAEPRDRAAALRLGAALVPPGPDGARVDLLLVGAVGRAPLAALQDERGMIVGHRPLVRVLGLAGGPRGPWRDEARVIAVTDGLPGAAREAQAVAAALGTQARLDADAGAAALAEVRGAGLLHVAAHARMGGVGPVLALFDRDVPLAEIAGLGGAPRVVVLATCSSATARDEGGWGSLASAFLLAGAETVVATAWSVRDDEVPPLIAAFYAAGGARDPARALGQAQAATPVDGGSRAWAAFTVIVAPPALR